MCWDVSLRQPQRKLPGENEERTIPQMQLRINNNIKMHSR